MSQYTRQTTFHAQTITQRLKQSPLANLLHHSYTNLKTRPRMSRIPRLIEVAWLTLALSWLKRSPVTAGVVTKWDQRKRERAWASVLTTPRAPRRSSWQWMLQKRFGCALEQTADRLMWRSDSVEHLLIIQCRWMVWGLEMRKDGGWGRFIKSAVSLEMPDEVHNSRCVWFSQL